jgi:hypothetical protein
MEDLCLDILAYAMTMADALALMYWGAGVDLDDVEFVLAPPRSMSSPTFLSEYLGEHVMWILDFDRVKHMSMDGDGLEQACAAFFRNDPTTPDQVALRQLMMNFGRLSRRDSWRQA